MSAFTFEYDHARHEGVQFRWHVAPLAVEGASHVEALQLQHLTPAADGSLIPADLPPYSIRVDQVVLAIGQSTHTGFLAQSQLQLERGRILIDRQTGQTTNPKFFAGGDCTNGGREVVDAVADGKRAALGICSTFGI